MFTRLATGRKIFIKTRYITIFSSNFQVKHRADALVSASHYDPKSIRDVAEDVTKRWQQLVTCAEERHKLVTASINFYKTAEQVRLGSFSFIIVFGQSRREITVGIYLVAQNFELVRVFVCFLYHFN